METAVQPVEDSQYPLQPTENPNLPNDSDKAGIIQGGDISDDQAKGAPSKAVLLNNSVQEIISAINDKRKRDTSLLTEFKSELEMHCMSVYSSMESTVYNTYEETNTVVEKKLEELLQVIGRINQLEAELAEFKSAFADLYSDLQGAT